MGRSRVHEEYILNDRNRHNTQVKRANGAVNKLDQLARLTGSHIVLLVTNENRTISTFYSTHGSDKSSVDFLSKTLSNAYVERVSPDDFEEKWIKDENGKEWLKYKKKGLSKDKPAISYVMDAANRQAGRKGTNGPKKNKSECIFQSGPMKDENMGKARVMTKMEMVREKASKMKKNGQQIPTPEHPAVVVKSVTKEVPISTCTRALSDNVYEVLEVKVTATKKTIETYSMKMHDLDDTDVYDLTKFGAALEEAVKDPSRLMTPPLMTPPFCVIDD